MVQETKRFLAYICPHCAQSVIVERNLFSLAAAPVHIKCPCGKSELGGGVQAQPGPADGALPVLRPGAHRLLLLPGLYPGEGSGLLLRCLRAGLLLRGGRRARSTPPPPGWSRRWTSWERTPPITGPFWTGSSWRRFWPSCGTSAARGASPVPAAAKMGLRRAFQLGGPVLPGLRRQIPGPCGHRRRH